LTSEIGNVLDIVASYRTRIMVKTISGGASVNTTRDDPRAV
jgi:hypothetical protein